jgi:protein O-mannosyl-transferase
MYFLTVWTISVESLWCGENFITGEGVMAARKKHKKEELKRAVSKSQKPPRKGMSDSQVLPQKSSAQTLVSVVRIPSKLGYALLAALCMLIYFNSLDGGMVNFDDAIVTHTWKKSLSWKLVRHQFLGFHGTYQPLRDLSHAVDYKIFGKNLWGHRFHSLLLYTLNVLLAYTLLLFLIRRYMLIRELGSPGGTDPGAKGGEVPPETVAFLIAALFAVHPVHVEAVAWLSARKEVLFGLFYFLSIVLYVKTQEWKRWQGLAGYAGSFLCYLLALLSKPSAASLPFILLVYDLILLRPDKKTWKRRILYHLPFWLPLVAALYYFAAKAGTTETAWATLNFYEQILTCQKAMLKYLEILFLPINLSARYFIPPGRSLLDPGVFAGVMLNAGMAIVFIRSFRRNPLIAFAIAWFYLNWLPTAGLVPISTKAADRYLFLSLLGFSILVTGLVIKTVAWFPQTNQGREKAIVRVAIPFLLVFILSLSVTTVLRNQVWKDEKVLWEDMATKTPTDLSLIHMAEYYLERGEWKEAEHYYWEVLNLNPMDVDSWNNLGNVLVLQSRPKEAEEAFNKVLAIQPQRYDVLKSMAIAYGMQRKYEQAENSLLKLVVRNPRDYAAWDLLADVRITEKHYEAALEAAQKMAVLEPRKAKPYIFMAESFRHLGKEQEAGQAYEKALALEPEVARAYSKKLGLQ